jgi:glucose/mannose-6-phosphate isomerase
MSEGLLDDLNFFSQKDQHNCHDSIYMLAKQCRYSWEKASVLEIPSNYRDINTILVSGMGGSSYGGRIIKKLFDKELKFPFEIVNDYYLPNYINSNSLFIAASYSGSTEETLSTLYEAIDKKAKIIGITSGGSLKKILTERNLPCLEFTTDYNPSKQPRLGQGYMQAGQIGILSKLGFINVNNEELFKIWLALEDNNNYLCKEVLYKKNEAKKLAMILENKMIVFIGAEFLEGAIHSIRNPMHETGKHFTDYFIVPEANHHLMEGLSYPDDVLANCTFVLINSDLYSPKIKLRMKFTKEVIERNHRKVLEIKLKFSTKLGQIFELIQFGSYLSFYTGILHNINPAEIPWVNYFKEKLGKENL